MYKQWLVLAYLENPADFPMVSICLQLSVPNHATAHTPNVSTNQNTTMKLTLIFAILYFFVWSSILFLTPKDVFYSGEGIMRWIIFGAIFFLLPYLLYKSIEKTTLTEKAKKGIAYLSVFLGIPFGLFLSSQSERELKDYGKVTYGIIDEAWLLVRKNRNDVWSVRAKYSVGNKTFYTPTKENPEKTLFKGDTITIIYSQKTPQMSKIKELKKQ